MGPAESVPLRVYVTGFPKHPPFWISLVTGRRRLEMQRQIEENRAAERRAMKKYRAWRKEIYERSLEAIRLLDLSHLPVIEHPYHEGELTFDLELPLRDRHGEHALTAHASNVEELEEAIQHWFAALTYPTRAREDPEHHAQVHSEGEEAERVRVADHYVKRIFHEDLPIEQRDALLAAIFRCKWFDIAPARLRNYFRGVMRSAAARRHRSTPIRLGGVLAASLDEPLPGSPDATLKDILLAPSQELDPGPEANATTEGWRDLWQFSGSIPPSQPRLRKMAAILLEVRDEKEAVERYGRGGLPQLKRLKREIRAWRKVRARATG